MLSKNLNRPRRDLAHPGVDFPQLPNLEEIMSKNKSSIKLIKCPDCDRLMESMDEDELNEIKEDTDGDFYQTCDYCNVDLMLGAGSTIESLEDYGFIKDDAIREYANNKIKDSDEKYLIYYAWRNKKITEAERDCLFDLVVEKKEINQILYYILEKFPEERYYEICFMLRDAYPIIIDACSMFKALYDIRKFNREENNRVKGSTKYSEKWYENNIVELWEEIEKFKTYRFISQQEILSTGIVDIYAECKKTGSKVIIELKLKDQCGHRQLFSYGCLHEKPILINISEKEVKNKVPQIKYLIFEDLHINFAKNPKINLIEEPKAQYLVN